MGTTADKLQAVLNSKRAIKQALIAKGAAVTEQTKFSQYAAVISQMSTGSGDIGDAYVVVEEDGVLKAQKLSFEGTTATPEGTAEVISNVGLFATGMDEPAYNGSGTGGGSMKFYKCTSVDTTNKTWSGYELVLQDGYYELSAEITSDLKYTTLTPISEFVYSENALIKVGYYAQNIPSEGLVKYEPLSTDIGSFTVRSGTPAFAVIDGISCIQVNPYVCTLTAPSDDLPSGNSARTISFWMRRQSGSNEWEFYLSYGGDDDNTNALGIYEGQFIAYYRNYDQSYTYCDYGQWHHLCFTYDGTSYKLYVDGVCIKTTQYTYNTVVGDDYPLAVGWLSSQATDFGADGYMTGLRIYNRVLLQEEINILADEFTPTTA